ncbi:transcriptional regulator family: Fungal Specific TF [Paecilomyces variotii]|nr:transcriptional regulator family: Fungal Specific TF [Paecilomyces variotii]
MNDSLQHLLHAVEPEFPSLGALPTPQNLPEDLRRDSSQENHNDDNSSSHATASRKRPAPRGTAAYPRKRANKACQVCRARRTKCDNKKPSCSFCEKVGAKCITSPTDLSSFDPASLAILEKLDRLEQLIRTKPGEEELNRAAALEQETSPIEYGSPVSNLSYGPDFSMVTIETVLSWPVFRNRFDSRLDLKALLNRSDPSAAHGRSLAVDPGPFVENLDLGGCNRLLDSFLERVHIANPILDVPLVRRFVHQACVSGIGWDTPSCLVLLLCALGSIAEAFQGRYEAKSILARTSPAFVLANSYFEAAEKRMGCLMHKGGVLEAQCFFYAGVYLMTLQQPMKAWRFFVQAAATSQGFDFPRKPLSPEAMTSPEARRERASQESMYWTCLKSELEVRIELSLPGFGLQDLSYPTSFPSPPSEHLEQGAARAWYYYLAEIALRRLANRILHHLFRNQEEGRFFRIKQMVDSTAAFESQAADWMASLPQMFSLATPEKDDDMLKFVLRGHLLDCYEWMYFPFMAETINHGQRDPSVDEYARKGLQMSVDRIRKNQPGFNHRHHGTWLMLRSCTRSALILLAASHSREAQDLMPEGWQEAVKSAMDMLRFWEEEVSDARDRLHIITELMAGDTRGAPYSSS